MGPTTMKIGQGIKMLEMRQGALLVKHDLLKNFTKILGQRIKNVKYINLLKIEKGKPHIWIMKDVLRMKKGKFWSQIKILRENFGYRSRYQREMGEYFYLGE
ncbi:hypothetical protein GYH30_048190 [Glycine max]|nr:hypothetical protein GYH30_048190 [Glycine max]